jgi:hypothetical protein
MNLLLMQFPKGCVVKFLRKAAAYFAKESLRGTRS